jgi:hypothetical protein
MFGHHRNRQVASTITLQETQYHVVLLVRIHTVFTVVLI